MESTLSSVEIYLIVLFGLLCPSASEMAIARIRDEQIREDGMGVPAAFADQPEDCDFLYDGLPMDKIDNAAAIVSMDMAVAGGTADRAGLPFGTEGSHIGLEQNF